MVSAKTSDWAASDNIPQSLFPASNSQEGLKAFKNGLKYAVLVPVFPLMGYYLLDQTGVSSLLMTYGIIPQAILGEGFGHVGLCFAIHYVIKSLQYFSESFLLLANLKTKTPQS